MLNSRKSINTSDLPLAESTHIEDASKTPKNSMLSWSRFGLRNNSSPISNHSQLSLKKTNQTNKSIIGTLIDPRVVLDAQSNGFASRVVKYHDESEAKTREISNKTYRRPGDFPIVNLDRTEHNLKPRAKAAPRVSTMSLSTPINLVSTSERSAIFRTGKNLGETLASVQHEPSLRLGAKAQNEPIITPSHEYDNSLACSSLDALKEISRKRIHCDELDGEFSKKQKPEYGPSIESRDSIPTTSKRTRDRVSPTVSSPVQSQKKRYRNNDILSSLSSSISIGLKRTASALSESTPITRTRSDEAKENATRELINDHAHLTNSIAEGSARDAIQRIGKSNSDIPPYQTSKPPEQVLKSMSDSSVVALASQENRKPPKFTLFNKAYNRNEPAYDGSDSEDDKDSVSYVKPKARTSSLFSFGKGRDPAKSKLSMMLNFLRGQDETTDEVDAAKKGTKQQTDSKTDTKSEPQTTVESKTNTTVKGDQNEEVPTLLGGTKVTFSTATTTSVLSATASTALSAIVESQKKDTPTSIATTVPETSNKLLTLTTPLAQTISPAKSAEEPKLQFSAAQASTAPVSISPVVVVTTAAAASPALTSVKLPLTPTALPLFAPVATQSSATKSAVTTTTTAGFTFGTPTAVASTPNTQPAASTPAKPFSFGNKSAESTPNKPPPPAYGTQLPAPSASPASPASSFSFGQAAKPTASSVPAFGQLTSIAQPPSSNVQPTFGAAPKGQTTTNAAQPVFGSTVSPATKPASNSPASSFVFGASNINKPGTTPTFGSTTSTTSGPPTLSPAAKPFAFGTAQTNPSTLASSPFQFSSVTQSTAASTTNAFAATPATTNLPSTNLFGATAADKTTTQTANPLTFGQSGSNPTTPTVSAFGASTATTGLTKPFAFAATTTNPTTPTSSPFALNINKPTGGFNFGAQTDTKPVATTASPAFGQQSSAFSFTSPKAGTAANPSLFGSTSSQQVSSSESNPFGLSQSNQSNQPNPLSATSASTPTVPAFGSSPFSFSANTNTGSPFGGQTQTQTQSAASPFGSASATNNLFSSSANSGTPATQNTSNMFGFGQAATAQQSSPAAKTSVFGSNNTNSAFGTTTNNANATFGNSSNGNSSSSGAFTFSAPKQANPVFGSATNNNQQSTTSFSFSAAANNNSSTTQSPFGNTNTNNTPTPSPFGNANNGSTSGSGSAFSFGGISTTTNNNDAAKPFNFSAAVTPTQLSGGDQPFAFGAPSAAAPVPNAFQFNAQPQANNIFSIMPTAGATKPRPVRALARRNK